MGTRAGSDARTRLDEGPGRSPCPRAALVIARQNPPGGVSLEEAVAAGKWILSSPAGVAACGRLGYARIAADVPSPPSI
jgi:hypothetical protein